MDLTLAIIISVCAVLLSGLFSGTEIAFVQSSKVRIGIDEKQGGAISRILGGFMRHQDMFISTILVGNNIVLVVYGIAVSAIINPWLQHWLDSEALVLISNSLISTALILVAGEFIPKTLFRINPNAMLKVFALPIYLVYLVLYPVSAFTSAISRGLMRLFGIKNESTDTTRLTMEQIDHFVQRTIDENRDTEQAVETEVKIFRNALDFKDTHINECMIPRGEIVAVDIEQATRADLVKLFISTGLSKIVVYKGDIDEVQGYIHVSELFNPKADWRLALKPVVYTPESMLANKMMHRLMAEKKSMAIVVDEFGGTAGLVTLEDLVEEIFGEIEDEHDRNRLVLKRTGEETYEISGRAEIQAINEAFNLELRESEEYHTLAGYILDNLEALPAQGDTFELGQYRFDILKMSATRIELVRLSRLDTSK